MNIFKNNASLIVVIIFLFFGTSTYSQISIAGKITDVKNNPLEGVEVYASSYHIGTVTDKDGKYKLTNVPHGMLTIVFSHMGYKTYSESFELHKNLTKFNIVLIESVFNMDEVIVSTPFSRLQSQNVIKIESAKIKNLKKQGATSLIEGVETIPGVSQISTGTSIGKPVIRGLSGNRVLVYAQGVRLENQQFGSEHGLGLSGAGIESVEVIKGPASMLYGSDALGGVLYFNPERFVNNDTLVGNFSQQYFTNTNGSNTSIGFKSSKDQWKFLVRGTYNSHSDYKTPTEGRVTNTRFNDFNLNAGIGYIHEKFSSEFRYNLNSSKLGLTEGIDDQTTRKTPDVPYQKINNHILSLHNHYYFDTSKIDFNLGYIFNDRSEFEDEHHHDDSDDEHEEDEAALRMKLKTLNYDLKYHLPKFDNVTIIAGLQGMHQTNENLGEELLIPNAKINDFGVFATAIADFDNGGTMQGGLRFDTRNLDTEYHEVHHENEIHVFEAISKNYNNITGSLGYKKDITEAIVARLNLAAGFRAPNLAELTSNGVHHGTNRFEIGNPNLTNEQNFQIDLAVEYNNKHFEFFVNGFLNAVGDYIYLQPTGEQEDGADVYEYTQDDANLYGGEMGIHIHPHPLDWLHIDSTFELVIGRRNEGKDYLPLIPANQWNNTIRSEFDLNNWLKQGYGSITFASSFKQNKVGDFETPTNSYTLVNLGLGGTIHLNKFKFDASINVNNLFDKTYISHLSRLKADGIPNIGRNVVFGIQFDL